MIFERLHLILDDDPHEGSLNMAIDEALARTTTEPVLRVYRWEEPCVSFGYFGKYDDVSARWPGRMLVRRWTGGGEVPHGEDFTYTIVVPRMHPASQVRARESYRAFHSALVPHLPEASLSTSDAPESPACFTRPVVADVIAHDRKVAGAAQRRGTFGLLHQGSVQGTRWPANLAEGYAHSLARKVAISRLSAEILAAAQQLREQRYGTASWLKQR